MNVTCTCCGGENQIPFGAVKDHSISGETFQVEICSGCGAGHTKFPFEKDIGLYYKSQGYISHTSKAKNLLQQIYMLVRKVTLRRKEKLLGKITAETKVILDYGCGTGDLLGHLKEKGWKTEGLEPDGTARQLAAKKGLTVYSSLDQLPSNTYYDTICLWHVLEHIPNPGKVLLELKDKLNAGGKILIAVPNFNSADARHYATYWAGLDVPRHLWHFSKRSVQTLSSTSGLKLNAVLPMKLDSYYVSLLSEEYKGNKGLKKWLYGIWQGLRSNIYAKKTGEWSSLIYLLSK